jgi:hypothetical protein
MLGMDSAEIGVWDWLTVVVGAEHAVAPARRQRSAVCAVWSAVVAPCSVAVKVGPSAWPLRGHPCRGSLDLHSALRWGSDHFGPEGRTPKSRDQPQEASHASRRTDASE